MQSTVQLEHHHDLVSEGRVGRYNLQDLGATHNATINNELTHLEINDLGRTPLSF